MFDQKMKDCRSETSSENLKFMQLNWNFVKRIVTGDETWIHHDDPETKQQSMQWKHASFPSLRKFTVQASADKIMCTVSRDAEDVLLVGYMRLTKWQLQGFTTLTYFTNFVLQLNRSAEKS